NVTIVPSDPRASGFSLPEIPLRPTMSVRLGVTVDRSLGLLTWDFLSIDPLTHAEAPVDSGFLLPNHYPPTGQGSVQFTVKPQGQLTTGTGIQNYAIITFDGTTNPPPTWGSTVDNDPPSSHVLQRGSSATDSATFAVGWEALPTNQPPGDLKDFTIYVAEDG